MEQASALSLHLPCFIFVFPLTARRHPHVGGPSAFHHSLPYRPLPLTLSLSFFFLFSSAFSTRTLNTHSSGRNIIPTRTLPTRTVYIRLRYDRDSDAHFTSRLVISDISCMTCWLITVMVWNMDGWMDGWNYPMDAVMI